MTPERSENIPPSAARISGVETRIVDQINDMVKISLIASYSRSLEHSELLECLAKESLAGYK